MSVLHAHTGTDTDTHTRTNAHTHRHTRTHTRLVLCGVLFFIDDSWVKSRGGDGREKSHRGVEELGRDVGQRLQYQSPRKKKVNFQKATREKHTHTHTRERPTKTQEEKRRPPHLASVRAWRPSPRPTNYVVAGHASSLRSIQVIVRHRHAYINTPTHTKDSNVSTACARRYRY